MGVLEEAKSSDAGAGKPAREGRRWPTVKLAGLLAFVTFVITAWYTYGDFQSGICSSGLVRAYGGMVNRLCKPEYREVSLADATQRIDDFFRTVGGAQKPQAWHMLTPELRELEGEHFLSRWPERVVGVERTRELMADEVDNQFIVEYRQFETVAKPFRPWRPEGSILRLRQIFRFQGSEDGVLIDEFVGPPGTVRVEGKQFAWAEFTVNSMTFREPKASSFGTRMSDVKRGKGSGSFVLGQPPMRAVGTGHTAAGFTPMK